MSPSFFASAVALGMLLGTNAQGDSATANTDGQSKRQALMERKAQIMAELDIVEGKMGKQSVNQSEHEIPCDVDHLKDYGAATSYYLFNKFHNQFLSTNGNNADLYHSSGSHAVWHFTPAGGNTNNRFYLMNDWKHGYLSSKGKDTHANVQLYTPGGRDDHATHRELQWLMFPAADLTAHAPPCTWYIMHSDSHMYLDTHGNNVHLWGQQGDFFEMGSEPQNMQWELKAVGGRW